jgi:hypothetical protein
MEEIPKHPDGASTASEPAATGSAKNTTATQPTAASPAINVPAIRRKHWIRPTIVTVLAGIVLAIVIWRMPAPARTFVALSAAAGVLVVGGLVTLIVLIPAAGSNPELKTEFYSARAAYFCVIAGLILFGVVAIGAVFARVMWTVGGH